MNEWLRNRTEHLCL